MIRTDGRQQVALVLLCAAVLVAVMTLGESVLAGYRIAFVTAGGFSLAGAPHRRLRPALAPFRTRPHSLTGDPS
ncbi:hypothetical protein ABT120_47255 [Nonomuraea angiospora]|uniref:hypothetical protein n=1 Tax=Nonomuraea angiospora TaxID=46172 RepID=UPI00333136D4